MSGNGSADGGANCYNFTKVEVEAAYYTKISVASLGILLSFGALLLLCISKVIKKFVFRLVFYLMLINLVDAVFSLLEVLPVKLQDGKVFIKPGTHWSRACIAFGFFDQILSWMGFTAIVWIIIYMLWRTSHLSKIKAGEQVENIHTPKVSWKVELMGISTLFIAPLVLNWMPFTQELYGQSGPWCWIKTTHNNCDTISFGVVLTYLLFFIPVLLVVLFSLFSFIVICTCGCKAVIKLRGRYRKKASRFVGEILLIVFYPLVYSILCIIILANRIKEATISDKDEPQYFPLWMLVAIADPARVVFLPLAFLIHPKSWKNMFPKTWKKICCKQENVESVDDEEYFTVSLEGDDIEKPNSIRQSAKINFAYGTLLESQTYDEA